MASVDENETAKAQSLSVTVAPSRGWPDFFREFLRLAGPYWASEDKWKVRGLTAVLVVFTIAQVVVQVALNLWIARLFDSLAGHSIRRFVFLLSVLAVILVANLAVNTLHLWMRRWIQIGWRRWLTKRISNEWMEAGHQYLVTYMPGEHTNPDGRIAEDIRNTTEFAVDLVHSFFYCVLLLVSFIQILWSLSGVPELDIAGFHLYLPGHLVWAAVLYAAAGTAIAWLLGRPMVRASDRRQTFEANFRFGLVHARENSLAVALLHGESDERGRFAGLFKGVAEAWNKQTSALIHFFYFQTSWSVLLQVFPILVAAPRFIAGAITLGALMQISQAFQQAISAMSWPIDNLAKVADWRASVERVLALHEAIQRLIAHIATDGRAIIEVAPSSNSVLSFRKVTIADPNGDTAVNEFDLDIRGGERVLVGGDTGAALKLLKAAVGLWPWGSGRIELPNAPIFFATQRPYLPIGSLRDAIAYPAIAKPLDDGPLGDILMRVGLQNLVTRLDQIENWEQLLAADEQQRLGFARLFIHRPAWIFIQEATDALDPEEEAKMMALLGQELPDATVVTIGHHAGLMAYHRRQFSLVRHDGYAIVEENRIT